MGGELFLARPDRIDAELAKADLPRADRRKLEQEREILQKSADYLGISRSRSEAERDAERAAGPPVLNDPKQQVASSADFITRNKVNTGVPFIDHGLEKAFANPALILYKLQANAYKFAWALIPLSLPFMWLLYPFSRRFHTYDHFVFVTYSISFMLLLFVAVRLLNLTIFGDVATFVEPLFKSGSREFGRGAQARTDAFDSKGDDFFFDPNEHSREWLVRALTVFRSQIGEPRHGAEFGDQFLDPRRASSYE